MRTESLEQVKAQKRLAVSKIESAFATAGAHGLGSFGYLAAAHAASARADASVGQLDQALVAAHRGIELADRRGDVPFGCLARIVSAQVCHISGDGEEARRLLATVEEDLERISGADLLTDRFATVRRQLRLQQPAVVRRDFERIVEELTDRETAILNLLPGEMTQREIGAALHMSFNTVKSYNRQIYRKLGVSSRDEAVEAAKAHGLL